jgi:hypothetical protein
VTANYFDIKQDKQFPCFCQACLVDKTASELSPDPRYCQGCYEFLKAEAEMLPATKRPSWRPKTQQKGQEKAIPVSQDVVSNMATVKDKKSKVAIIHPTDATRTLPKRGPKHKALPVELITQWASEGMGYKRIAARLKVEHGIEVGFRTVARVVKGERKQLTLPIDAT